MIHTYDFISKTITTANVKSIILRAGFSPADYTYQTRVDNDGFVVRGEEVMSLTRLRNAAKQLRIRVEICSAMPEVQEVESSMMAALGGGQPYSVDITLSPETVTALNGGTYYLYGFKAVQATQGGGKPLVWFKTEAYSANTNVAWTEDYEAYTSRNSIITNGEITASFSTPANLGETLQVQPGGVGPVVAGGPDTAISILNTTDDQFTCGISERQDGVAKPMCAFPLYGNQMDVIAPIEKVLFMFSTKPVNTGTVVEQAYSSSILIDLTSSNNRAVSFDINKGWDWGGFNWGRALAPDVNLVPLLIEPAAATNSLQNGVRTLVSC